MRVKTINTPRIINAILLNIKINQTKWIYIYICVAINWQNFTEIYLAQAKLLQKLLGGGGYYFTHTVHMW